jgi:hypothetical protein
MEGWRDGCRDFGVRCVGMRFGGMVGAECNCAGVKDCIGSDVKSVRREHGVVRMRDRRMHILPTNSAVR